MKNIKKLGLVLLSCLALLQACKKDNAGNNGGGGGGTTDTTPTTITPPTEPAIANTQGFFLDNWQAKTWVAPATTAANKPDASGAVTVTVDLSKQITKVSTQYT